VGHTHELQSSPTGARVPRIAVAKGDGPTRRRALALTVPVQNATVPPNSQGQNRSPMQRGYCSVGTADIDGGSAAHALTTRGGYLHPRSSTGHEHPGPCKPAPPVRSTVPGGLSKDHCPHSPTGRARRHDHENRSSGVADNLNFSANPGPMRPTPRPGVELTLLVASTCLLHLTCIHASTNLHNKRANSWGGGGGAGGGGHTQGAGGGGRGEG